MCAYKTTYEDQIDGEKWAPSGGLLCLGAARAAHLTAATSAVWEALCSDIDESQNHPRLSVGDVIFQGICFSVTAIWMTKLSSRNYPYQLV